MNKHLLELRRLGKTVFTSQDIAYVFQSPYEKIRGNISYYCRVGYLRRLHSGIFILPDQPYDPLELAGQILRPSYISLGSVLRAQGVIFQEDRAITLVSYKTTSYEIDTHSISVRCLRQDILLKDAGIRQMPGYAIASRERALLDSLYLSNGKISHFDNLRGIDLRACEALLPLYWSEALERQYHSLMSAYAR